MRLLLAFASLLSLLLLTGCRREGSANVFVDPALAILVPADSVAIGGVRMSKLAETPVFQRWVVERRFKAFEEIRTRTGLDLSKDIWELIAASDGKQAVLLLRGRFAQQGREPQLPLEGARRWSYKGYTLIGNDDAAVAFLNPTTAVAGPVAAVQRILDRRETATGIPTALNERIQKIPSSSHAWFVASISGTLPAFDAREAGIFANLARLASQLQYAWGGVNLREAFRSEVTLESADEASAEQLRGALRALLGIGRLSTTEERRELLTVYDGMQVTREKNLVRFTTDVPFDLLEKAAAAYFAPRGK